MDSLLSSLVAGLLLINLVALGSSRMAPVGQASAQREQPSSQRAAWRTGWPRKRSGRAGGAPSG